MNKRCSPRSAPMAMNVLVPVFPLAPDAPSGTSLVARSRPIRDGGLEGLFVSPFIKRLLMKVSL